MGKLFSKNLKDARVIMFGMDSSGKTTLLYKMKAVDPEEKIVPTVGFNVETLKYKNFALTIWDVGGQHKQPFWKDYYENTHAIIFVVDSDDRERLDTVSNEINDNLFIPTDGASSFSRKRNKANNKNKIDPHRASLIQQTNSKDKLYYLLEQEQLKDAVLLVLCNKQDIPHAMSVYEISERLELSKLKDRKWYIQGTSATTGEGLHEAFDWLCNTLNKMKLTK